jgi:hypothetical protein
MNIESVRDLICSLEALSAASQDVSRELWRITEPPKPPLKPRQRELPLDIEKGVGENFHRLREEFVSSGGNLSECPF